MSESFKQEFDVDASKALQSISEIRDNLGNLSKSFENLAGSIKRFNQDGGKVDDRLGKLRSALDELMTTSAKAPAAISPVGRALSGISSIAQSTAKALKPFTISLETLSRVAATQVIVHAFSALKRAVTDSIGGFIEFSRAVKATEAISPQPAADLAREIRSISDAFNIPLLEAAAAKHNIVSDAFQNAAESATIFAASARLARVGEGSLANAALTLTTVLNAYGLEASNADRISAQLFRTIDVGRATVDTMSNAFGQVAPLAAEAGVELEEVMAAFASITIGGANVARAATNVRASISSLVKPSKAMAAAIREMGFESGEQLLQAEGLVGAFDRLSEHVGGTTSAMSKLFPNLRAINAVLRLTGTGADTYRKSLEDIQSATAELILNVNKTLVDSDAERIQKVANRIKNALTVDVGGTLTETIAIMANTFPGAIDTAIGALGKLGPAFAVITTTLPVAVNFVGLASNALVALTIQFGRARAAALAFNIATGAGVVGAIVGGYLALEGILAAQSERRTELIRLESDRIAKITSAQAEERVNIERLNSQEVLKILGQEIAETRRLMTERAKTINEGQERMRSFLTSALSRMSDAVKDYYAQWQKLADTAAERIKSAHQKALDIRVAASDRLFAAEQKGLSETQQIQNFGNRANKVQQEAIAKAAEAFTDEQLAAATAGFERARALKEQQISVAQSTGDTRRQLELERELAKMSEQQAKAQERYAANVKKTEQPIKQIAASGRNTVEEIGKAEETLANALKTLDEETGRGLGGEALKELKQNVEKARLRLIELQQTAAKEANLAKALGLDTLPQKIDNALSKVEIKALQVLPATIETMHKQVQAGMDGLGEIFVKMRAAGLDVPEGNPADALAASQQQLENLREGELAANNYGASLADLEGKQAGLANSVAEMAKQGADNFTTLHHGVALVDDIAVALSEKLRTLASQDPMALSKETIQEAVDLFEELGAKVDTRLNPAKLEPFHNAMKAIFDNFNANKEVFDSPDAKARAEEEVGKTKEITAALREKLQAEIEAARAKEEAKQKSAEQATQEQNVTTAAQATEQAQRGSANAAGEAANKVAAQVTGQNGVNTAIGQGTGLASTFGNTYAQVVGGSQQRSISLQAQVNQAVEIGIQKMAQLEAAANRTLAAQRAASAGQTAQFGGMMSPNRVRHFAAGGIAAQGSDSVPAMLSRGEAIINAKAARTFFSQINSMNAGMRPADRSSGATSIQIGDINVSESSAPRETAREVMALMKRELRRGASNLRYNK